MDPGLGLKLGLGGISIVSVFVSDGRKKAVSSSRDAHKNRNKERNREL